LLALLQDSAGNSAGDGPQMASGAVDQRAYGQLLMFALAFSIASNPTAPSGSCLTGAN